MGKRKCECAIQKYLMYPVLEAILNQEDGRIRETAEVLDLTLAELRRKRVGRDSWLLEECILIRDRYAPALTIEEVFYVLPRLHKEDPYITEKEMLGGFNPEFYE
jgi:hypothetical protein